MPRQGYRLDVYRDDPEARRLPMLAAAVSAERLFDLFLDLLEPLGERSTSCWRRATTAGRRRPHATCSASTSTCRCWTSHFCDFEDLLLNDGCTGVAVISDDRPMEVQFDEHKLLVVYAPDLKPFRRVLGSTASRGGS